MRDRRGRVLYVGKALSLRARLRQYQTRQDERFFVHLLEDLLGAIEWICTASESEALLLERELVKRHQPPYNVKLRDDKSFLHLRLGSEHAWPRLEIIRRPKEDGARYFGPYPSAGAARATLYEVNGFFRLRSCRDAVFANRARPCLEHQLHRCDAPCVLPLARDAYTEQLRQAGLFLTGKADDLVSHLKSQMDQAAAAEDFERAARLRDQWQALQRTLARQHVALVEEERDLDVFGLHREGGRLAIALLTIERGRLVGARSFAMPRAEFDDADALSDLIGRLYDQGRAIPDQVLVPVALEDAAAVAAWLSELRQQRGGPRRGVEVRVPQRGDHVRLLELAADNARQAFAETLRRVDPLEALLGLQRKLGLARLPRRIECFDNSNIQGSDPVAAMVVFRDGVPDKGAYRQFVVRDIAQADDFATMYQVVRRRLERAQRRAEELPDLIVVDGGPGQLKMAVAAASDLGLQQIELIGLAKARAERGEVDRRTLRRSPERVWRPDAPHPLILPQTSEEVLLLVRLRDEAHRFAITFHRQRRDRRTIASVVDAIPGIGAKRRSALLRAFPSIAALRGADLAAVAAVPGIGQRLASDIVRALAATPQGGAGAARGDVRSSPGAGT